VAHLHITQTRSTIGAKRNQRETLRSLGLKRIRDSVVLEDKPEVLGMVYTVTHMVSVEVVSDAGSAEVDAAKSNEGSK